MAVITNPYVFSLIIPVYNFYTKVSDETISILV